MSRLRPSLVNPLDNEDLLHEILLRLSPLPSSLPRASLVCKRWCSVLSDPRFSRRFRVHHRKPPLLGFFVKEDCRAPIFTNVLDPPNQIPTAGFALPRNLIDRDFLGCRDGVALFLDRRHREAILWDPITNIQRQVAYPLVFDNHDNNFVQSATVLCSVDENRHVRGYGQMSPFKLVLACNDYNLTKAFTCIYESESGLWGNIISTRTTDVISRKYPSILVGSALCWLLSRGDILEFDFQRQTLVVIEKPEDAYATNYFYRNRSIQILRGEDNSLGLAILSRKKLSIQLWARKPNCDVVSWVLQKNVQLDKLYSSDIFQVVASSVLQKTVELNKIFSPEKKVLMSGYDEETNVIILSSDSHVFMLQLESMQFRYIGTREYMGFLLYYPYTSFYIAGILSSLRFEKWLFALGSSAFIWCGCSCGGH